MPRSYRHVKNYESEIINMRNNGLTYKAIGKQLGMSYEQIRGFFKRKFKQERMIEAGKAVHKKGRPSKSDNGIPPSIQRLDKLAQMRYVMASKDRYIKRLEMENELMRDFLSLTGRK